MVFGDEGTNKRVASPGVGKVRTTYHGERRVASISALYIKRL